MGEIPTVLVNCAEQELWKSSGWPGLLALWGRMMGNQSKSLVVCPAHRCLSCALPPLSCPNDGAEQEEQQNGETQCS